jgi:predicted nucleotidyltransferase
VADASVPVDSLAGPFEGPLEEQVARIGSAIRQTLGRNVLGVYLYGSAVVDGLRPASDVDVFVVARRGTTRGEKRRLFDALTPISDYRLRPAAWHPVEVTVVVQSAVRPWRYPPETDFLYGEWLRGAFEAGNVEPEHRLNPDLAVVMTTVLETGRALIGPPPGELLDPVPDADVASAAVAGIDGLLADLGTDTRNVLLTLARIWSTVATGSIRSKDAAADWAIVRLPEEHRAVLVRARDGYRTSEWEDWDDLREPVRRHAAHVVRQIRSMGTGTRGEGRQGEAGSGGAAPADPG